MNKLLDWLESLPGWVPCALLAVCFVAALVPVGLALSIASQ